MTNHWPVWVLHLGWGTEHFRFPKIDHVKEEVHIYVVSQDKWITIPLKEYLDTWKRWNASKAE